MFLTTKNQAQNVQHDILDVMHAHKICQIKDM
jgi:hypothetical protein